MDPSNPLPVPPRGCAQDPRASCSTVCTRSRASTGKKNLRTREKKKYTETHAHRHKWITRVHEFTRSNSNAGQNKIETRGPVTKPRVNRSQWWIGERWVARTLRRMDHIGPWVYISYRLTSSYYRRFNIFIIHIGSCYIESLSLLCIGGEPPVWELGVSEAERDSEREIERERERKLLGDLWFRRSERPRESVRCRVSSTVFFYFAIDSLYKLGTTR